MGNKVRHTWSNGKPTDTFVVDKTNRNVCSVCGLHREQRFERNPFTRTYYVYYHFNLKETRTRPECLQGNKDQIKMF